MAFQINNIGCNINAGYSISPFCSYAMSGIKEVYMAPNSWFTRDAWTFDTNDKITSIYLATGRLWYKFDMISETAEYNEKEAEDSKSGSKFWNQQLTILFHHNDAILRKQMLQLINTNSLTVIFRDNTDTYFLAGKERGMEVQAEVKFEKNKGGFNGQILNLAGLEKYPAYEVVGSAVTFSSTTIRRNPRTEIEQSEPTQS